MRHFRPIHLPSFHLPPIHLPLIHLPPPLPPPPKPRIDMDALQKAVGIIGGVIALSPIGKLVETGIMTVADIASNGKASQFVNNGHEVNKSLNLLPGGMLAQQLLNDATGGKSGSTLDKFVPDPMKMVIHDTVKIGETIVLHPSQTLQVGKDLGNSNVHNLHNIIRNYQDVVIKTKPTMHQYVSAMVSGIKEIELLPHNIHKEEKHISNLPSIFHIPHTKTHPIIPAPAHSTDHPIIKNVVPHLVPKHIDPIVSHLPAIFHIPHTETHPIKPAPTHIMDHPIIKNVVPQTIPKQVDPIMTPLPAIFSIAHTETEPLSYKDPSPISIPMVCLGALCLGAFMYR